MAKEVRPFGRKSTAPFLPLSVREVNANWLKLLNRAHSCLAQRWAHDPVMLCKEKVHCFQEGEVLLLVKGAQSQPEHAVWLYYMDREVYGGSNEEEVEQLD